MGDVSLTCPQDEGKSGRKQGKGTACSRLSGKRGMHQHGGYENERTNPLDGRTWSRRSFLKHAVSSSTPHTEGLSKHR